MGRLLLSAGHTLDAPGDINGDLIEAELTRKILRLCIPYLEAKQIEFQAVPLDLPLLDRIDWINRTDYSKEKGDLFIEIHINNGGKRGIEAWYGGKPGIKNQSQTAAEFILNTLCKKTGFTNQGAKSEFEHEFGQLIILNQPKTISTVLEILYIDNEDDIKILRNDKELDNLAKNLADSISDYFHLTEEEVKNLIKKQDIKTNKTDKSIKSTLFDNANTKNNISNFPNSTFTPKMQSKNPSATTQPKNITTSSKIMDKNERKDMIIKTYELIFGTKPEKSLIDKYVNKGIGEEQLIKELINSDKYKKMIKEYTEYLSNKEKFKNLEIENTQIKQKNKDLENLLANLSRLLEHRNALITRLRFELTRQGITLPGEFLDYNSPPKPTNTNQSLH
jgi:hypothetical protein